VARNVGAKYEVLAMSMFPIADSSNRDAWLTARKGYVTASAVASILGCGFQSRKELLAIKTGQREEESLDGLAMIEAGNFTERGVLDWFYAETPHGTSRHNTVLYGNTELPDIAATPDGLMDGLPVDVKVTGTESFHNWYEHSTERKGWPDLFPFPFPDEVVTRFAPMNPRIAKASLGTPRGEYRAAVIALHELRKTLGRLVVPLKYVVQCRVQMAVCGVDEGWLTASVGGTSRVDFRMKRDLAFESYWRHAVAEFVTEVKDLGGFR
jgi:hypothetical protein